MRIPTICMQCQAEGGGPNFSSLAFVHIPDECVLESTCSRGHRTRTVVQQMKFEMLSDMAIQAIVDGYYRDAIVPFMGSLERLYEFFIEATCRKHGIAPNSFAKAWKEMAAQSERQFGAFVAAFLLEIGEIPTLLSPIITKFRNEVVHKGKFPGREETISFGQDVLECARPILDLLKSEGYSEIVWSLVTEKVDHRRNLDSSAGAPAATCSIGTFFSLTNTEPLTDVEAAVASYAKHPDMARSVAEAQAFGAIVEAIRNAASTVSPK